jgi:hypothetical protein
MLRLGAGIGRKLDRNGFELLREIGPMRHVPLRELRFPVLYLGENHFAIWRSADRSPIRFMSASHRLAEGATSMIVDSQGCALSVTGAMLVDPPGTPKRRAGTQVVLICDEQNIQLSVHDIRTRIIWLVSARGHFESPEGFGIPSDVESARTIQDLFDVLERSRLS